MAVCSGLRAQARASFFGLPFGDRQRFAVARSRFNFGLARASMPAAPPFSGRFVVLLPLRKRLLLQKRLTVGDRNLIIIGMNFGKGQEAVAITTIFDEASLQ